MQVTLFYNSVFMIQHYILYVGKKGPKANDTIREPLVCPDVTCEQIKGLQKSSDPHAPQEEV